MLRERLRMILDVMLADDRRAWQLGPDDRWQRVESTVESVSGVDTFETLMGLALASTEPPG